jgi:hypothetical protein
MFVIVELFDGMQRRGEEKRMIVNNTKIHCICKGVWHNETH